MTEPVRSEAANTEKVTNPGGGWTSDWAHGPSRGFWLGLATVGLFAAVLLAAGAFAAGREPEPVLPDGPTPTFEPVEVSYAPRPVEPDPDLTRVEPTGADPVAVIADSLPEPMVNAAAGGDTVLMSGATSSPVTAGSSWSSTPVFEGPAAAPAIAPSAEALARDTEVRFGIDIVLESQDWGADEDEQRRNIGAVASAISMLPERVSSSVVTGPSGPLTVLSNRHGRTQDGWQPYGDSERTFFTNSDQGRGGHREAHQVVLATGSGPMTVVHELIHAYTFRHVGPNEYVLALLGPEMRSFMAAAGWEQRGTDEDVLAAATEPWEKVNGLFAHTGETLRFVDSNGYHGVLDATNPLEAVAMIGAIYYARPTGMELPAWDGLWAWFDANLG